MESVAPSSCLTSDVEGDYGRQGCKMEYPTVASPQASTGWAQPREAVPAEVGFVMKRSENVTRATAPIAAVKTQESEVSGGAATFRGESRGYKGFKELKEMYLRERAVLLPVLEGDNEEEDLSTVESKEQPVGTVYRTGENGTVVSREENPKEEDVTKEEQCSSVVSSVLTKTVQVDAKVAEMTEVARGIATPTSPERGLGTESGAGRDAGPRVAPEGTKDEKTTGGSDSGTGPSGAEPTPKPRYDQLFTDKELDTWERGESFPAEEELEEFDKELEVRLIPLDEVELQQRMKKNAEGQKPLTTGEQSEMLGIPEEVLERTKKASSEGQEQPEYWLSWYEEILARTEEAKRANRDFREAVVDVVSPVRTQRSDNGAGSVPQEDTEESSDARDEGGTVARSPSSVDEEVVRENVLVTLDGESSSVPEDVVHSVLWWRPSKIWRTVARKIVYKLACEEGEPEDLKEGPNGEVSPERDKARTVAFDWRRAAALAKDTGLIAGTPLHSRVLKFAEEVYRKTARKNKRIRLDRGNTGVADHTKTCARGAPVKKVRFKCSALGDGGSKVLDDGVSGHPCDDDSPVEVQTVKNADEPAESSSRSAPGLVDALEVGDEDVAEATRLKSERVICSIGPSCQKGVEAVSTGYLEDFPAELLVDSGAVASLVDQRMLKLLGRDSSTLRPYEGGLNSVTGSPLQLKGVLDRPREST